MTIKNTDDGGYYAIKGFSYQVDKTILELLNTDDENKKINIEQIQDIGSSDFVMQVKYKETAKLIPSEINKAISQLIEEFKTDKTKKYILYAYFKNSNGYKEKIEADKKISKELLNELLGGLKSDHTEQERSSFVDNFYLDLSPEFQDQFNSVILKLQDKNFGNTPEETIFYYANIFDFIYKLVTSNPTQDTQNRTCTQKEIFDYLRNGKQLIFDSSFREYQGDEKYFSFIKGKYFLNMNVDYRERFIVVDLKKDETISDIKDVVVNIKNKFYNISGGVNSRRVKSPAPYIYLKNISDSILIQLKTELLEEGISFKDGYDFKDATFFLESIKEKSTIHNNICLKLMNSEYILQKLLSEKFNQTKEIYQFCINKGIKIENDVKNIRIQIKHISDINSILT